MLTICVPQPGAMPSRRRAYPQNSRSVLLFPEAGVHPALQHYIVRSLLADGGGIIITYSEVICRFALSLVRKHELSPTQLQMCALHIDDTIQVIPVDEDGRITEDWPGGFFTEVIDIVLS